MTERWYLFIRLVDMPDMLRLGWLPLPGLQGSPHGNWSVLAEWVCSCGRRPPCRKRLERASDYEDSHG